MIKRGVEVMPDATPFEHRILCEYHRRYVQYGFPRADDFIVKHREISDIGKYVHLSHQGILESPDGELVLGNFSDFEMDGMRLGGSFTIDIKGGKARGLDIIFYGDKPWDGLERNWRIVNPDTGKGYVEE
jgi:hypothetical protein